MGKKRRRKRRKSQRQSPAEFKAALRPLFWRSLEGPYNGTAFDQTLVAVADLLTQNELGVEDFYQTDYGKAAIDLYEESVPKVGWPQDPSKFWDKWDAAKTLLFEKDAPLNSMGALPVLGAADFTYRIAQVFEHAFAINFTGEYREAPYENEAYFRFISTAQPRFQAIYRFVNRIDKTQQDRYAICKSLPAEEMVPHDPETERIRAMTMTELYASGNNAFIISDTLREMFLNTEIQKLDIGAIDFPYSAFQVVTGERTVFFTHVPITEERSVWIFDNVEYGCAHLKQDADTETLGDLWECLPADFWDNHPESATACDEAFQMVCNLSLYLSTRSPEVRSEGRKTQRGKGRKKSRRQAELDYTPIRRVLYPSASKTKTSGSASGSKRQAHWVRGHWRKQPYGPRDNPKYERIWIEPHMRGGEEGPSDTTRKYKV